MTRDVKDTTNSIFSYAFTGSLLFVAAFAYTLLNLTNIAMFEFSYTAMATLLCISSISLLLKAAIADKNRFKEI